MISNRENENFPIMEFEGSSGSYKSSPLNMEPD
jgi:hypothetical protein